MGGASAVKEMKIIVCGGFQPELVSYYSEIIFVQPKEIETDEDSPHHPDHPDYEYTLTIPYSTFKDYFK